MNKCPNCLKNTQEPECECRPPEDTCPVPAEEEEDDNMHEPFPVGDDWCIRNLLM